MKKRNEMDQAEIGKFIQSCRKAKNITQRELAETLGISDKTLSKWENGNYMPDITVLPELCRSLDISVNELISGEYLPQEKYSSKAEENILHLLKTNERTYFGILAQLLMGMVLGGISWFLIIGDVKYGEIQHPDLFILSVVLLLTCACAFFGRPRSIQSFLKQAYHVVLPIGGIVMLVQMSDIWGKGHYSNSGLWIIIICSMRPLLYALILRVFLLILAANEIKEEMRQEGTGSAGEGKKGSIRRRRDRDEKIWYGGIFVVFVLLAVWAYFSDGVREAKNRNAYERSADAIRKEYDDTDIHVVTSNERKLLYEESKFENRDGKVVHVLKDFYEYDLETGTGHKLILSEEQKDYGYAYVFGDQLLAVDARKFDLYLLDDKLQVIAWKNLQNLSFPGQETGENLFFMLSGIRSDGQYLYITGYDTFEPRPIVVLDKNLEEKAVFFPKSDMVMVSLSGERVGFVDSKKKHLYGYDGEKNELVDLRKTIDEIGNLRSSADYVQGNSEYDYFYYQEHERNKKTGVWESVLIGVKGRKREILFDSDKMGFQDLYIERIQPDPQNGFWIMGTQKGGGLVLYHLTECDTPQDYSPKADKKHYKLGSLLLPDADTQYALDQFNMQSDDYYFETVVYQAVYKDKDMEEMRMFWDCLEGRLDGVLPAGFGEELTRNDALYDVGPYLEERMAVAKEQFVARYRERVTTAAGESTP